MWGREIDVPAIPWEDVEARLADEDAYWLITVPPRGVPAPRPVWGVWLDERLLLSVGSRSHWSALEVHPEVAVHLGDPLHVVVLEGLAHRGSGGPAYFQRFVDAYNAKYDWSFKADEPMVVDGLIEVTPTTVLAWTTVPVAECSSDMQFPSTAGRWVFE
jgi:hypothetical protein